MVATCSKVLMMPTELEALSSPDLPLYHALLTRGTSVAGTTCGTVCLPWNTIPGRKDSRSWSRFPLSSYHRAEAVRILITFMDTMGMWHSTLSHLLRNQHPI